MTVKTLIMFQKISISNKCCSFELPIHQRICITEQKQKCITVSANTLNSTPAFNNDNHNIYIYILSSKSAYYNYLWRIMWLKTGVM